jgi:hypothetical protein
VPDLVLSDTDTLSEIRTARVIPKMEKIMSDWTHTCMPAKKTVVKATTVKISTGIIIVLAISG